MLFATIFREGPNVAKLDDGSVVKGYYYTFAKEWKEYDDNDEEVINSWIEDETWIIYPDGIFEYHNTKEKEQVYKRCHGTFDSSRYNTFVEMMKNFKTDWKEELEYDEKGQETFPIVSEEELDS